MDLLRVRRAGGTGPLALETAAKKGRARARSLGAYGRPCERASDRPSPPRATGSSARGGMRPDANTTVPLRPLGPTRLPRGFQVEPTADVSRDRMLAGLRAYERFRLAPASYAPPLPGPRRGQCADVEFVLDYRCGAAPDVRRVPFSAGGECLRHQHGHNLLWGARGCQARCSGQISSGRIRRRSRRLDSGLIREPHGRARSVSIMEPSSRLPPERECPSGGCGTRRRPRVTRGTGARAGASDSPRRLQGTRACPVLREIGRIVVQARRALRARGRRKSTRRLHFPRNSAPPLADGIHTTPAIQPLPVLRSPPCTPITSSSR